jgi:hypothetical protein
MIELKRPVESSKVEQERQHITFKPPLVYEMNAPISAPPDLHFSNPSTFIPHKSMHKKY